MTGITVTAGLRSESIMSPRGATAMASSCKLLEPALPEPALSIPRRAALLLPRTSGCRSLLTTTHADTATTTSVIMAPNAQAGLTAPTAAVAPVWYAMLFQATTHSAAMSKRAI